MKIVIAEDERAICHSLAHLIEQNIDIEIAELCYNGIDTLAAIIDQNPDIVVTDLRMPGLDGLQVIEKVREMKLDCIFIILTAYDEFAYAQKAIQFGVRSYLVKPYGEEELLSTIRNAIDERIQEMDKYVKLADVSEDLLKELESLAFRTKSQNLSAEMVIKNMIIIAHDAGYQALHPKIVLRFLLILHSTLGIAPTINDMDEIQQVLRIGDYTTFLEQVKNNIIQPVIEKRLQIAENDSTLIQKCEDYVLLNYSDSSLSLKKMAENELFMNVDYVSRQFKKKTGEKFSSYLTRIRMEKAVDLLKQGYPVGSVAMMVGYGYNVQYFSNVFKKYFGMSPSRYEVDT